MFFDWILDLGLAYFGWCDDVPKLQRNLISLSQLDSKGCRVSSAGGVMKITRGGMVLMKGEQCGRYHLVCQTLMDNGKQECA
ncbi:hypothetical protein RchiOBHm_Chr2g0157311 [Rosa chinensis]|uniref:Uncharacterized protein n=1 Tax=Rosa chinensis TaxID=74649 RepID=A0A2P6S1N8_ROSCH|nr:hypothetical protein RchiOBHm_Chr2g0157311 [Rosa chinensis]